MVRPAPSQADGASSSSAPRPWKRGSWRSWPAGWRPTRTAPWSASSGGPGVTPGTPAPGQEREAARYAGETVLALEYEAHEAMALRMLDRIADEIETRYRVERLAIVHRLGEVPLGEISVAIVVASPHRGEAFSAARYAMDETKGRVPIWKAERFATGRVWIGEPAREGPLPGEDST